MLGKKQGINLDRMDYPASKDVRKVLAAIALDDNSMLHQYTAGIGHPRLMRIIAKLYSPLVGRELDKANEMLITSGANESLLTAILGHVDNGDEVIVIEPFFRSYVPLILSAGGIPRYVPLRPWEESGISINGVYIADLRFADDIVIMAESLEDLSTMLNDLSSLPAGVSRSDMTSADWVLDSKELAALFNSRTKMIILNTPHSPLGKVHSRSELEEIADLCKKHDVLCLSDEVLEWMVYEPSKHVRVASLPSMWERTITVCSASKTLLVPGWKVGWAYGPAPLIRNMKAVYQNSSYTPLQEAVSRLLENEMENCRDHYFSSTIRELACKRSCIINILKQNGFNPTLPEAGYLVVTEWTKKGSNIGLTSEPHKLQDFSFTNKLAEVTGVVTIPLSEYYSEEHKPLGDNYAALCFLQAVETLLLVAQRFKEWSTSTGV